MSIHDYADLGRLSVPALKALLNSGDGRERVWAAWELGIRVGGAAVPMLSTDVQADPGVRSHLVVVLAGLGQTDILRTLAVDDPVPAVRAVACDYLFRVTPAEEIPETVQLLEGRIAEELSDAPVVRILERWPSDWPEIDATARDELLSHSRVAVRAAALDHLVRLKRRSLESRQAVLESMAQEPDGGMLITKASFVGAEACVDMLVRRSAEEMRLAPVILNFLIESELTLGWTAIRPHLLTGDPARVNMALRLADHGACQEHPEYIARLGEILTWGEYQMPSGAFALSDSEQKRRWAFSSAKDIARERIWSFLDTRRPIPRELEPALDAMLLGLEEELHYFLSEDVEYLEEEGVDISAEIADLNERRRVVLRAKEVAAAGSNGT